MNHLDMVFQRYPVLEACRKDVRQAAAMMIACYEGKGKILLCGNGGSQADADHMVGELMKGFLLQRPIRETFRKTLAENFGDGAWMADHLQEGLPAISLGAQTALNTAISNDVAADMVFAQQVYGYAVLGDADRSQHIRHILQCLQAIKVASARGLGTIGISGADGGKLSEFCQCTIALPETETFKVQELTLPVYHALCAAVEAHFYSCA
ncbi:MAG: SIS domain-containing protein [Bianqueaceae bacterium]